MKLEINEIHRRDYIITFTSEEVEKLLEDYAEHGSPHFPINHSFCHDITCVTCKLVKQLRQVAYAKTS